MLRAPTHKVLPASVRRVLLATATAVVALSSSAHADSFRDAFGALYGPHRLPLPKISARSADDSLHRWNLIAINASGLDHTPVVPGDDRIFGQQLGPTRASRAVAIVHIAMADAVAAIERKFRSFT